MFEIGTLDQFADIIMGQSPKGNSVSQKGQTPLLNGPTEFGINHPTPVQFTNDPKRFAKKGDLLFCVRGSTGRRTWADQDYAIGRGLAAITPKDGISNYFLRGSIEFFLKDLLSGATGSVFTNINKDQLHKMKCYLPDEDNLKKINQLLGNISQKIELNQEMNKTLEEIAKTLFKSWFIDFDPVRAKVEGRSTGLSKELSDLFPDSLEDSECGEIPKEWKLSTFGDFVTPSRGNVITKKTTNPGDIPVVAGGLEPAYFHSSANVQGPVVTISASGANAGYTSLYYEDIWASDCSYISNKQTSNVFTAYTYLKLNQKRIFDSQHGAAQPHIYPDDLKRLNIVIPNNDLYEIYENLITSFFNKIKYNRDEIKNLTSLRDTLLPKLISGEVKISDTENIVEEVGI